MRQAAGWSTLGLGWGAVSLLPRSCVLKEKMAWSLPMGGKWEGQPLSGAFVCVFLGQERPLCGWATYCKQLWPTPLCFQTINALKGRVSELQWSVMNQEMQVKSLESEKQELKEQLALQHK